MVGLTSLALMIACTDRIAAPKDLPTTADAEFSITGSVGSSLWQVDGADVVYAGSVRGSLVLARDKEAVKVRQGTATVMSLPPATIAAAQHELRAVMSATRPEFGVAGAHRPDRRVGQTRRGSVTPLLHRFTSAGKQFETRVVADKRSGRPPHAVAISSGG